MKLRFIKSEDEVDGVKSFTFAPPQAMQWQPGQYMHYILEHPDADDRGVERWFTISTAPFEQNIRITTRVDGEHSSSFKKALQLLKAGDEIEADGPKGKFVLREGDFQHVMIAGGIGITPFRSMLAQLAHDKMPAHATLFYANRDNNLVFGDELTAFQANDQSIKIVNLIDKRLTVEDLADSLQNENTVYYLSGPKAMVESYEELLQNQGVSEDNITTDYFPGY